MNEIASEKQQRPNRSTHEYIIKFYNQRYHIVSLWIKQQNETLRWSYTTTLHVKSMGNPRLLLALMFLLSPVICDISDPKSQYLMNPRDPQVKRVADKRSMGWLQFSVTTLTNTTHILHKQMSNVEATKQVCNNMVPKKSMPLTSTIGCQPLSGNFFKIFLICIVLIKRHYCYFKFNSTIKFFIVLIKWHYLIMSLY